MAVLIQKEVGDAGNHLSNCFKKSVQTRALLDPRLVLPRDVDGEICGGDGFLAGVAHGLIEVQNLGEGEGGF